MRDNATFEFLCAPGAVDANWSDLSSPIILKNTSVRKGGCPQNMAVFANTMAVFANSRIFPIGS